MILVAGARTGGDAMTTEPLVLAVDDESGVRLLLRLDLTAQGFRVITTATPSDALAQIESSHPDLILVDVSMPEMSGFELLRELRKRWHTPVIFLTARDRDSDKVRGLADGADDYVVKPFSADELAARIRAVLRRKRSPSNMIASDGLAVDLERRTVSRNGNDVSLTRTEWLLLEYLAAKPGKVILATELLSHVWGPEYRDDLQYLRIWVSRLRAKIERDSANPAIVKTRHNIGYVFIADVAASES